MQNNANELRGNMRIRNPSVGDCEVREVESETKAALGKGPHDAHLKQLLKDTRASRQVATAKQSVRKRPRPRPHPENDLLLQQPDFAALADKHPALRPYLRKHAGRPTLTWRDWNATHALAQVLFAEYFEVAGWSIPEGRLVPAIPNRLNYLLWVNDLLDLSRSRTGHVHGLDVGCGCNLVYPLIGASRFGWHFTAADNDETAVASANKILECNPDLKCLIELKITMHIVPMHAPAEVTPSQTETSSNRPGALACAAGSQAFDFCVCNPPFFSEERESCTGPAAYGGVSSEMVCQGGEQAFVQTMVADSLAMQNTGHGTCHWYTAMVGKKSTFRAMRTLVNGMPSVTAVRTKELVQGKQSRWVLGWSFTVPQGCADLPLQSSAHARMPLAGRSEGGGAT